MCVAIPGRVVRIGQPTVTSIPGRVSIIDTERDVDLVMVPNAVVGDYVVVHSGYAIEVIPRQRAVETMALFGIDAGE
ncbi:MAG: HypC/HybG/HupF family hydrogenase formation chaperone [Acidimicrobiia bacterium]